MPSTHGMLLFGNKVTYASHLPMFHKPHNYQLIMKLSLSEAEGGSALTAYQQEKDSGETFFTIMPEAMDLTKVIDKSKTSFQALLFKGHFERFTKYMLFYCVLHIIY